VTPQTSRRLVHRTLRHDRRVYLQLLSVALVATFLIASLHAFSNSIQLAQADAVASSAAGRTYIADANLANPDRSAQLRNSPHVDAVWLATENASTDTAVALSDITLSDKGLSQIVGLIDGRAPTTAGEAAISSNLATALTSGPGDSLRVDGQVLSITAVFRTPTEPSANRVSAVVDIAALPSRPPDVYFVDRAALDQFGDLLTIRSVRSHLEDGDPYTSSPDRVARISSSLAPITAAFFAIAVGSAVVRAGRSRRRDFDGLNAAGLSLRHIQKVFRLAAGLALLLGGLLGLLLSVLVFAVAAGPISSLVGQDWISAAYPGLWSLRDFALIAVLVVAVGRSNLWLPDHRATPRPLVASRTKLAQATAAAAIATILYVSTRSSLTVASMALSLVAALSLALASAPVAAAAARTRLPSTLRRVVGQLSADRSPLPYIAAIVLCMSAFAAGIASVASRDQIFIPPGALILETVAPEDAEQLRQDYLELNPGEQTFEFQMPEEEVEATRLASGDASSCIQSTGNLGLALRQCENLRDLSNAAQSATGLDQTNMWQVGKELLGTDGTVSIIRFDPQTGAINSVTTEPAVSSELLGGYNVGGLAPRGTTLSEGNGLSYVLLAGYTEMPTAAQANMRSRILRHAGYSLVFLNQTQDYGLLSLEIAVVGLAAALALLLNGYWGEGALRAVPGFGSFSKSFGRRNPLKRLVVGAMAIPALGANLAGVIAGLFAAQSYTGRPVTSASGLLVAFVLAAVAAPCFGAYLVSRQL